MGSLNAYVLLTSLDVYLFWYDDNVIDQDQAVRIYRRFVDEKLKHEQWYGDIEAHIKATLLYGSVAKGLNREDSDIDILIIIPLAVEEEYTKGEYFYSYQGNVINIVLRSIEKLRIVASEKNDIYQKEIFRYAHIIDIDSEVNELLFKINDIQPSSD